VLKIANFHSHGKKDLSQPNVTGIVELADPENHTIEPKIMTEVMANFLVKFPIFRYHGNRGHLSKVTGTIKLADPENPLAGARIWGVSATQAELYSLPWQQGYVQAKCDWHSWPTPKTIP